MKRILVVVMLIAISLGANAQSIPEFKNKVMLVDKDQSISNLESVTLTNYIKTKVGAGAVGLKVDDENSPIVFDAAAGKSFIVKIEPGVDPESIVTLYKFTIEKKKRTIITYATSISGMKDTKLPVMPLSFKKVQDGVYNITAMKPLEEGEYVFIVSQPLTNTTISDVKGFAFSVAGK